MKWIVFALLLVVAVSSVAGDKKPLITQELVDTVNQAGFWKADFNKGSRVFGISKEEARGLCGVLPGGPVLPMKFEDELKADLPETFSSQENWPQCTSIETIRDQSRCGSCWAIAAAEAMSDRTCIHLGKNVTLSTANILACCGYWCGFGCSGGYPSSAWKYYNYAGVVEEECYPYPFPACSKDPSTGLPPCPKDAYKTPTCPNKCTNSSYPGNWKVDLHHGSSAYSVSGEKQIMMDIMKNGPVEGSFTVYEDFMTYKSGVYRHVTGSALGGHAIKIVGWGVEDGQKYWKIANSWNIYWGDKGFVKMLRGTNECGIEGSATAGLPKKN